MWIEDIFINLFIQNTPKGLFLTFMSAYFLLLNNSVFSYRYQITSGMKFHTLWYSLCYIFSWSTRSKDRTSVANFRKILDVPLLVGLIKNRTDLESSRGDGSFIHFKI